MGFWPFAQGTKPDSAEVMAKLFASLDGADDYGIPPLTVYHRFNSAGGDVHGSSAFSQGGAGWSAGIDAKFNFANLVAPGSPFVLAAGAGIEGARLASSAVVLYRMPEHLSMRNRSPTPLTLAKLDGVSWSGTGKLNGTTGVSWDLLKVIAGTKLTVSAGLQGAIHTTRLTSAETTYFANSARSELTEAVDRLLVLELRKACATILVANAGWMRKNLVDVVQGATTTATAFEAAANKAAPPTGTQLPEGAGLDQRIAQASHAADIRRAALAAAAKAATAAKAEFEKDDGWKWALAAEAGIALGAVAGGIAAYKVGIAALKKLETSDEELSKGLLLLQKTLDARANVLVNQAQRTSAEQKELDTLTEARLRLIGYSHALHDKKLGIDRVFGGRSPANPGANPPVDAASISRKDGTCLTVTSKDWEVRGDLDAANKAIAIGNATFHADASISGRHTTAKFRMRAANNLIFAQHTHSVFMHMTASAASSLQLVHSGSDAIDKAALSKLRREDKVAATKPGTPFAKRFGALTYRAANVYCRTSNSPQYEVEPGVSAITLGVSVRTRPLCNYAEHIHSGGSHAVLAPAYLAFEKWLTDQLGCTAAQLRAFVEHAPLGTAYAPLPDIANKASKDHGHAIGYPVDALLIEVGYALTGRRLPKIKPLIDDRDLFEYHGFSDLASFRNKIGKSHQLAVMRLRYRLQSAPSRTSKKAPRLGFSYNDYTNFGMQIGRVTEVGQESIVDLHTHFHQADSITDQVAKYDYVPPSVALFNRG